MIYIFCNSVIVITLLPQSAGPMSAGPMLVGPKTVGPMTVGPMSIGLGRGFLP